MSDAEVGVALSNTNLFMTNLAKFIDLNHKIYLLNLKSSQFVYIFAV